MENLLSGFIGAFVGAGISFLTALWMKNKEVKAVSLTNAKYIASLLKKERASLGQIDFIINKVKKKQRVQQAPISGLFLGVKQENLEKILMYGKFYKKKFLIQTEQIIQMLITAEQTYRDCYKIVDEYNQLIHVYLEATAEWNKAKTINQIDMFLDSMDHDIDKQIYRYREGIDSTVESLEKKYNEAVQLNDEARKIFDNLCQDIFGNDYKPVLTDGIVLATDKY
jgi:Mor family transcriptional regulator